MPDEQLLEIEKLRTYNLNFVHLEYAYIKT